jgi:hypothetical protein
MINENITSLLEIIGCADQTELPLPSALIEDFVQTTFMVQRVVHGDGIYFRAINYEGVVFVLQKKFLSANFELISREYAMHELGIDFNSCTPDLVMVKKEVLH